MSTPFAVQVVGPRGGEWFMNADGALTSYEAREQFPTREACQAALDKGFPIFRQHGFLVRIVNTEEATDQSSCEACLLGEMACAY